MWRHAIRRSGPSESYDSSQFDPMRTKRRVMSAKDSWSFRMRIVRIQA